MNVLSNGASVAVTVPAGSTLKARGAGLVTFGPGAMSGQSIGVNGPSAIGPLSAAATVYLTGSLGMRWGVYNGQQAVQAIGAYVLDPEDNGQTIECTTTLTITTNKGLTTCCPDFGAVVIPSGTTSFASDGVALLNGATTTLTRAAASNSTAAIIGRASAADSYVVTGS